MLKIFSEINKHVNGKKWECIIDGCNESAINSHLLQKNGILNNVVENGHIIEMKMEDYFKWKPNKAPIRFVSKGVNDAFSLKLFCNNHDTRLFKDVENHPLDLKNYRNQLLLSYRVICAEIRKKEIGIEYNIRILNSRTLFGIIDKQSIELFVKGSKIGIEDLMHYKSLIEQELEKPNSQFLFEVYKYPLIQVFCAASFSISPEKQNQQPWKTVFIHGIPYDSNFYIIVGYHKDYVSDWILKYVQDWANLNEAKLEEKLTNLFATRVENWGISPNLFRTISKEKIDIFINFFQKNTMSYDENLKLDLNLFR